MAFQGNRFGPNTYNYSQSQQNQHCDNANGNNNPNQNHMSSSRYHTQNHDTHQQQARYPLPSHHNHNQLQQPNFGGIHQHQQPPPGLAPPPPHPPTPRLPPQSRFNLNRPPTPTYGFDNNTLQQQHQAPQGSFNFNGSNVVNTNNRMQQPPPLQFNCPPQPNSNFCRPSSVNQSPYNNYNNTPSPRLDLQRPPPPGFGNFPPPNFNSQGHSSSGQPSFQIQPNTVCNNNNNLPGPNQQLPPHPPLHTQNNNKNQTFVPPVPHPFRDEIPFRKVNDSVTFSESPHNKEKFEPELEKKKKIGMERLNSWLQMARKSKPKTNTYGAASSSSICSRNVKASVSSSYKSRGQYLLETKVSECIDKLQCYATLVSEMSKQAEKLETMVSDTDKITWQKECDIMEGLKVKWKAMQKVVDKTQVQHIKRKLMIIRKKRARRKQASHVGFQLSQEEEVSRQLKEKEINDWQHSLLTTMKEEMMIKKRKEEMDQTLGEITKKISDAYRLIETMTGLEKLRLIRQDAARKRGDADVGESRENFEQKIKDMTRLVNSQLEVYKEEEMKLRNVIKSGHEASSKKEQELRDLKDKDEQRQKDEDLNERLFGFSEKASMIDPLFSYQQFYQQAETSFSAFCQIRHAWDQYIVPVDDPGGSTVPQHWVHPTDPKSSAWSSALT